MWNFFLHYFALVGFLLQIGGLIMVAMILWHERDVRRHQSNMAEATHAPA